MKIRHQKLDFCVRRKISIPLFLSTCLENDLVWEIIYFRGVLMIYENDLFQPLNESIVLDGIKPLVLMVRGSRTRAFNCCMKESYLIVVDVR